MSVLEERKPIDYGFAVNGIKEAKFCESDLDLERDSKTNGGTDGREGAGLFTRR